MFVAEVLWFENFDLVNIQTPVKYGILKRLLRESNYDSEKAEYLVKGFKQGFDLEFEGEIEGVTQTAPNLMLRVGNEIQLWNKVMKEVKLGRYAGPFEKPPFEHFIQSPIGLVPKDGGKDTRLIFHLSFPRNTGKSVNAGIPTDKCSVEYPSFEKAIELCRRAGKMAFAGKSDLKSAFRNVPLLSGMFCLLIMKAKHPISQLTYFFADKCLPFGSSVSCKIFQEVSDGLAHIVMWRTNKENVNYLDDFLFVSFMRSHCNHQLQIFIDTCNEIGFPIAVEKTEWASSMIIFLGLLIDLVNQIVCIPEQKVERAKILILDILSSKKGKTTVFKIQRLAGFLNFLCKSIIPGRAFTGRLYSLVSSKLKPHHHVRIPKDVKSDLELWLEFLEMDDPRVQCRPFMDFLDWNADDINMYSDASGNLDQLGFGAYCNKDWMSHSWCEINNFAKLVKPSIQYLELFALTAGVLTWIHRFSNRRIWLFCDNKSTRDMINASFSRCKNCMVLLRLLALESMKCNIRIYCKYVASEDNVLSDALSRGQMDRFWHNAPDNMSKTPTKVPERMWPLNKIWINE